jgi:sugar/nucleoside kinase (ribokinase family)
MNHCEIAVVGEIYIDHIFMGFAEWPQPGEEAFATQYIREIGGGAANTACALGRLGRSVSLLGVIGVSDAAWFDQRLQEFGVSSDGVVRSPGCTGVTASVSMTDERSFFTYAGENGKLMNMLRLETVLSTLKHARHVHFALPLEHDVAAYLLPALRAAGCTTSLDVGFQTDWLRSRANLETCRATDYFLPNEREAFLMCNGTAPEYLEFAHREGFKHAVVKLGSRGAVMLAEAVRYEVSSPCVDVVDTTGAGDAFDAGFIDALLDNAHPDDCLRRACIVGGLSTRVAGALSALPHREEITEIYGQTYAS